MTRNGLTLYSIPIATSSFALAMILIVNATPTKGIMECDVCCKSPSIKLAQIGPCMVRHQ